MISPDRKGNQPKHAHEQHVLQDILNCVYCRSIFEEKLVQHRTELGPTSSNNLPCGLRRLYTVQSRHGITYVSVFMHALI